MYLHLGNDVIVRKDGIIGIFDLDNTTQSARTRAFLSCAERAGEIVNAAGDELPKSFIIVRDGADRKQRVFLSQLNSSTLFRRSGSLGIE